MEFESKLIPIMREGVEIVKMIFFRKLKDSLSGRYADRDPSFCNLLTGAVVNELFGTPNRDEPFAGFAKENRSLIEAELALIAKNHEEMRIPLTDALRMQTLCDHQDGIDSTESLNQAEDLGLLLKERDLPLPHTFIKLVRTLGNSFGILIPPQAFEKEVPVN